MGVSNGEMSARQELTEISLPILLTLYIKVTKSIFHDATHGVSLFTADMTSLSLKAACMPTCGCSNRKRKKKKNMAASAIVLRRRKTINIQRNEDPRTMELQRVDTVWF